MSNGAAKATYHLVTWEHEKDLHVAGRPEYRLAGENSERQKFDRGNIVVSSMLADSLQTRAQVDGRRA